jgi:MFS transporter, FHS family, glucose/mannose:H+ symporter
MCQTHSAMDSASFSTPNISPVPVNLVRFEWFLLHVGFVLIGIITASLGPLIPVYTQKWGITDAQAGYFFPAQYVTSIFGVIATGWLLPRLGTPKVLALGFFILTLGMAFLGVSPWYLTAFCVMLTGLGYGLSNPTTNLRGTQLPSSNVAAAVSLLNFSWGVGAVACPFIVKALVPSIGIQGFGLCVAVFTLALSAIHFFRKVPAPVEAMRRPKHSLADWKQKLQVGQAIPLLILFFLYVGTEASFGGWVAALQKRLPDSGHVSAVVLAASVFYGLLLLGRGMAPFALRHFSTVVIAITGSLTASVGGILIVVASGQAIFLIGVAAAGLGCASLFPVLVTWLANIYGEDAQWVGALYFSAAGLGGGILPKLVGTIATQMGSLRMGLLVPLVASVGMMFLALRARPKTS